MESEEHPCFRASTSSASNANKDEEEITVKLNESHGLNKTNKESSETSQNEVNAMATEKQRSPSGDSADYRKKKTSRDAPTENDDRDSPERKKRNPQESGQSGDLSKETPGDSPMLKRKKRKKKPRTAISRRERKKRKFQATVDLVGYKRRERKKRKPQPTVGLEGPDVGTHDGPEDQRLFKVGVLLEICEAKCWPPPKYEILEEGDVKQVGVSDKHFFTIECSVLKFREVGHAGTKKAAKNLAAMKMWKRLQSEPFLDVLVKPCISKTNDETSISIIRSQYSDLNQGSILSQTDEHGNKVSQLFKLLKKTCGESIGKLQRQPLNGKAMDFVSILQEIATGLKFEVTYEDINEKSYSGLCQCLLQLQLTTLPVAVCQGSGLTHNDAQSDAAKNALEYLKIMTRKKIFARNINE